MSVLVQILGSGAAPGVPSLASGWLDCNADNPKNRRLRTTTYIDYRGVEFLIDTSPDIREQLLSNDIRYLDGVLYTHTHSDHLLGIDYLREINRINQSNLNFYASKKSIKTIKTMFPYIIGKAGEKKNYLFLPSLVPNQVNINKDFYIKDLKITPINLLGHSTESLGYIFNDGEMVYIADFKNISEKSLKFIKRKPKLLIIPLTTIKTHKIHAGLKDILIYIEKIGAEKVVINHMAGECDYDNINSLTPNNVYPAFDNMKIEF